MAFKTTSTVSQHQNQVNTFIDKRQVYETYCATVSGRDYRLTVPSDGKNKVKNEVLATLDYQEIIDPALRQLIAGFEYQPKEQFQKFKLLCQTENVDELRALANKVAQWKGFRFAGENLALSLEFMTEWTDRGARAMDHVHAFGYADFLATQHLEDTQENWDLYLKGDSRARLLAPFRQAVEQLTALQGQAGKESEGMSLSTALQDFRRQETIKPLELLVGQEGSELDMIFIERFKQNKEKLATIKQTMQNYPSIPEAYKVMASTKPIAADLETANNLRREIGGTGFLFALQQAIKGKGVSQPLYETYEGLIKEMCELCHEMDRCNFEILLGYGKYEGDAIPSAYAFFKELMRY